MHLLLVISVILFNCFARADSSTTSPKDQPSAGLHKYREMHEAKLLIDVLSSKLHLNLQTYHSNYEKLKRQSKEYLMRSGSTQDEIRMLNKLKGLLNDLTRKSSVCDKFYTNFDLTAARKITINSGKALLPKDFTVAVEVNHRKLIDSGLALANGNDLRIYFQRDEDCQPREVDRILESIATTKTKVLFKLQEDLVRSVQYGSTYYLVYGKKDASKAKHNPENVYLFYDDFSHSNLEKKWQKNWGSVGIENGLLKVRTLTTPTGDRGEISVFVKHGHEWEDIEVELDFKENNNGNYPGAFLRVKDARIRSTSAWWFEYHSGNARCTMRPFKNNQDGSWLYTSSLKKVLAPGKWTHAKYRVIGDRFSHWVNYNIIHNNIQVASKWMINEGTFGLGCHSSSVGCQTFYDNIKITKYVPVLPTVSLAPECRVDLKKFHGLGTSEKNPATSCKQIHDISLQDGKHRLENGVYWIKTSVDASAPTYCDLENGGWTLVGKISGVVNELHKFWLIKNFNVAALSNAALPSIGKVGCIDARYLATYHASTVMFSSGENRKGIGAKWVQWSLPEGRESDSLWTHSVGFTTISQAQMSTVTVRASGGSEKICYQNKFGVMPLRQHGGSYPSATYNTPGNTDANDYCMAIGVQKQGTTVDGWTQSGNGYDSPQSNSDWPNSRYNHGSPYVTVWLK